MTAGQNQSLAPRAGSIKPTRRRHCDLRPTSVKEPARALPPPKARRETGVLPDALWGRAGVGGRAERNPRRLTWRCSHFALAPARARRRQSVRQGATPHPVPPPQGGRGRASPFREACQTKGFSVSFFLEAKRRGDPGATGAALRSLDFFVPRMESGILAMTVRREKTSRWRRG
jgi:hypothetical protein